MSICALCGKERDHGNIKKLYTAVKITSTKDPKSPINSHKGRKDIAEYTNFSEGEFFLCTECNSHPFFLILTFWVAIIFSFGFTYYVYSTVITKYLLPYIGFFHWKLGVLISIIFLVTTGFIWKVLLPLSDGLGKDYVNSRLKKKALHDFGGEIAFLEREYNLTQRRSRRSGHTNTNKKAVKRKL